MSAGKSQCFDTIFSSEAILGVESAKDSIALKAACTPET